jgi:hypothetical protein
VAAAPVPGRAVLGVHVDGLHGVEFLFALGQAHHRSLQWEGTAILQRLDFPGSGRFVISAEFTHFFV